MHAGQVMFDDFDGGDSTAPGVTVVQGGPGSATDGQGYKTNANTLAAGFSGNLFRASSTTQSTFTLSNLPPHSTIDISLLFAAIDSWDPVGPFGPDFFQVYVDDVLVFQFTATHFGIFLPNNGVTASELITIAQLGFGAWTDAAFDLTNFSALQNIAHTGTTAKIGFKMSLTQGINDESMGIENLRVSIDEQNPLVKEIVTGDVIIPVKDTVTTSYQWKIIYNGPEETDVLIVDTAPAESVVKAINTDGTNLPLACGNETSFDDITGQTDVFRGGKLGRNCHSSTHLEWTPSSETEELLVDIEMRKSPGKGHKEMAFAPTSCGALYLNNGAKAYEIDSATGLPKVDETTGDILPPLFESNRLCVAVVKDPTEFGPTADNDIDGIADFDEACNNEIVTDPCNADTDNDTILDGADNCPLVFNPDQANNVNDATDAGDACEDSDEDGVLDINDVCPFEGLPINEGDILGLDGCIIPAVPG